MSRLFSNVDWKVLASLVGLMVVVVFFWSSLAVYPLKILVVFFHELSHGLAALLTGGSIERIELVAQEGGLCVTSGGNRFVLLTAGYLGSLVWGGLILLLASRTRIDRAVSIVLGLILVAVSVFFIRPFLGFGFFFGLLAGLALGATGVLLSEGVNDYLLRVIGLTSCMYAVLDIKSDIIDRPGIRSDAAMLSDLTGLPTLFWGFVWIAVAVVAAFFFLLLACKTRRGGKENQTPRLVS